MDLTLSWIIFILNRFLQCIETFSFKHTTIMCQEFPFSGTLWSFQCDVSLDYRLLDSTQGHKVDDHFQFLRSFDHPLVSLFTSEKRFDI
jgi:hypothetical protein